MKYMGQELVHAGVKSLGGDGGYFRRGGSKEVVEASVDVKGEQFGPLVEVWE
jgi:hypothetical protein